jgi:hypothetical protein
MTSLFWQFSYLQVLDLLSTFAFMLVGVKEANPFIKLALVSAPHPVMGLLAVKVLALGLAFVCMRMGKAKLLGRINVFFAILVAWNMVALIAGAANAGKA